ncbi:cytochrome c oxidase subunit 7A-related protein, mitochondrial isoform X1 [Loxodonta africana]|uniref:cytochrome c oxidase subunit 7A-related protein, mitochondrial isoform X1 n=1 Tax=Loxodonta africana TaxID=9785 RepID=UPI0005404041|nr:cytochrome c oxidase subunit 7A-related protein, mitochondrial isoform X1 [Loxodonta africana]
MYYKFSGFTQKLAGAWASDAYNPQGLKPVVSTEAPPIIFATPTKLTADSAYDYAGKNKVPELQKLFQLNGKKAVEFRMDSNLSVVPAWSDFIHLRSEVRRSVEPKVERFLHLQPFVQLLSAFALKDSPVLLS